MIAYIAKHPEGALVRHDMKVVFFDEWERPPARLKGAAWILRSLVAIAERAKGGVRWRYSDACLMGYHLSKLCTCHSRR